MVYCLIRGEEQRQAVVDWRQALVELRSATDDFYNDGVPIAVEGLRMLATYIHASAEAEDDGAIAIATRLSQLADHNERYERRAGGRGLPSWAPTAKRHVEELERSTTMRIGPPG